MPKSSKLSLFAAILININIMLGSGIFINTVLLAQASQSLGALAYLFVGLLIFPLILVVAELLKYHNGGTFYDFGATVHPVVGFISSWSYFTAKLASCALGIHVFVTLMQQLLPLPFMVNPLVIDSLIITFFVFLNLYNVRIGRSIQYGFIVLKLIPITMVILGALWWWFDHTLYTIEHIDVTAILSSVPFVLFAFSGFEASASLSRSIENPSKNGPRAILISYGIVLTLLCLYQVAFFGMFGPQLAQFASFRQAFPALAQLLFDNTSLMVISKACMLIGIAASSLGASYGIMYSNVWNLYTLAHNNHVFGAQRLVGLNSHSIPYIGVGIEGLLALCYVWLSAGNQVPLQQISALGSALAYCISSIVFVVIAFSHLKRKRFLSLCGLASCLILLSTVVNNALNYGITAYCCYGVLIVLGLLMYGANNRR